MYYLHPKISHKTFLLLLPSRLLEYIKVEDYIVKEYEEGNVDVVLIFIWPYFREDSNIIFY